MNRLVRAITWNWPLKLMAIALATLLYAGLVLSQNAQSRDVSVPIEATNQQANTILVGSLGEVTEIRYFVTDQASVTVASANFTARVDLAQLEPGPQAQSVRVAVESADPRIQVISVTPAFVSVKLEKVVTKVVPVVVLPGTVPEGLDVQPPQPAFSEATVRGAQTDVARVAAVRAVVPIDASGIDIDRDFTLSPVDELGEPVRGVEVEPASVHVAMVVIKDLRTASVPIAPAITGNLAPGFEVVRVTASTPFVTIRGDADDLAEIATARTIPISIEGRSTNLETTVAFDLPQGVAAVTPVEVTVRVVVRPVAESRTFSAGIILSGARADRTYSLSTPQALLTIGGSPADLDRLDGAQLAVTASVADLDVGVHQVTLEITVQAGLTVVAITPTVVTVTVAAVTAPAPSASAGG